MESHDDVSAESGAAESGARTSRSWPAGIYGSTSLGWAATTRSIRSRSSPAARASIVYDEHGNRYLDGLSGLFCCNAGHGRAEIGEAMARQVRELDFITNWSYAHPRAIELAARIASLTPGRPQPRSSSPPAAPRRSSPRSSWCANYHRLKGKGQKHKVIAREVAYHGTTMGALMATGLTGPADARMSRSPRAAATCRTRTSTTGPRAATSYGPRRRSPSGSSSRAPRRSPP